MPERDQGGTRPLPATDRGFGRAGFRLLFAGLVLLLAPATAQAGPGSPCGASGVLSSSGTTRTCTYTAVGQDAFSVPPGVDSLSVTAIGASGGAGADSNPAGGDVGSGGPGGQGAEVTATLAPSAGTLHVSVGGKGSPGSNVGPNTCAAGSGGANGGGPGGDSRCAGGGPGGGGGASDVRTTPALEDRVVVAGGGGGGAGGDTGGLPGAPGGNSGGSAGTGAGDGGPPGGAGALGNVGAGGGAGGTFVDDHFIPGSAGASGSPGQGGVGVNGDDFGGPGGGGGGGGYAGGGGGAASGLAGGGGGGGGSSFGPAGATFTTATPSGDGLVTISYTVPDATAPVLDLPADIAAPAGGPGGAAVTFDAGATDDVDGEVPATCAPASGATFAIGKTTVTCTASDQAGNEGTGSFTVTIADTAPPVLTLPDDITEAATGPEGAVVVITAQALDAVDGPAGLTCNPDLVTFPIGDTTVTCTASDQAGNEAKGSFVVTVTDDAPPALDLPADIAAPATGPDGAAVTFAAGATDAVDGTLPATCAPASGATFPVGASTVACTAEDAAGNVASGSFTVTVTPPPPPPPTPPAECPRDTGPFLPTLGPRETRPDLALPGYRLVDTGPLNEVAHGGWLAVDACFRLPGAT